jgi:hypothetical protein
VSAPIPIFTINGAVFARLTSVATGQVGLYRIDGMQSLEPMLDRTTRKQNGTAIQRWDAQTQRFIFFRVEESLEDLFDSLWPEPGHKLMPTPATWPTAPKPPTPPPPLRHAAPPFWKFWRWLG